MNIKVRPTYLIIGAAILLSACSRDDIPAPIGGESKQIVFRTSLSGLATRAGIMKTESLHYFQVTAFDMSDPDLVNNGIHDPLFDNKTVEAPEGGEIDGVKVFTSEECVWPDVNKEDHTMTFFGFYPGLDKADESQKIFNGSKDGFFDYQFQNFRVEQEIAKQEDFITANSTGNMNDNMYSGVELLFKHQLSRINVMAYSGHKSCDIEIAGVRIGGVYLCGTFNFRNTDEGGFWSDLLEENKGVVEYIFGNKDQIISLKNGEKTTATIDGALPIMGNTVADGNNAMVIPAYYRYDWKANANPNGMYISVLLRITDATLPSGKFPENPQRYPYTDLSQGADAMLIPRVYLLVDKANNTVITRVYKKGDAYFINENDSEAYTLKSGEEVKEFGWATVPVTGNFQAGKIYTYKLDFTLGIGLHDPEVTTTFPKAGDPVISDKVGFTYTVKDWEEGGGDTFTAPGS